MVISPGLIEKMEATIEAELVEEDEGKIFTAADLFRLPVSQDDDDDDHHHHHHLIARCYAARQSSYWCAG